MKRSLLLACFILVLASAVQAQTQDTMVLKKGIILDSLQVRDSITETFSLYLPTDFDVSRTWPVVFIMDMEGRGKEALSKFKSAAEKHHYLLAASNNLSETLPVSDNILIINRLINSMIKLFPIHKERMYTAGYGKGGKMASVVPIFIRQIDGVISVNSAFPNWEILSNQNKFQFVGVVGREDYNYHPMRSQKGVWNRLKYPNDLLFHDGNGWPNSELLQRAVQRLSLFAMQKGVLKNDSLQIETALEEEYQEVQQQLGFGRELEAGELLSSMINSYKGLIDADSLESRLRTLKRDKGYRTQSREVSNLRNKESLIRDEYEFNLLQDLDNLNYNNLGWWNFQMSKLRKYEEKPSFREKQLGKRLIAYLNALVEDNIDIEQAQPQVDEEAVSLLWMIKTITDPTDFTYYLKIISDSARYEDFGTALFYLEELLKQGFTDKEAIYDLEHTALFRITPEFNELIGKYLNAPRYKLNEE